MKALVVLLMCAGCATSSTKQAVAVTRPGVLPYLSELPGDAGKRDAILDQAAQTPGPELRKGQTAKEKRVETAAATAAAILGNMFSTTKNVSIGAAGVFDENEIVSPTPAQPPRSSANGDPVVPEPVDTKTLVPWVKVTPAAP